MDGKAKIVKKQNWEYSDEPPISLPSVDECRRTVRRREKGKRAESIDILFCTSKRLRWLHALRAEEKMKKSA